MIIESNATIIPDSPANTEPAELQLSSEHQFIRHILIMDDEAIIREIAGRYIRSMGYAVVEAKDGNEALELCTDAMKKEIPINGALFDLIIPDGLDGKDVIREFRKKFPDIPVFALSWSTADPVMIRPSEYGFTGSICKPIRKYELLALLNKHLKIEEQRQHLFHCFST